APCPPSAAPDCRQSDRHRTGSRIEPLLNDAYVGRIPDVARMTAPLLSAGNWGGSSLHLRGNIAGFVEGPHPHGSGRSSASRVRGIGQPPFRRCAYTPFAAARHPAAGQDGAAAMSASRTAASIRDRLSISQWSLPDTSFEDDVRRAAEEAEIKLRQRASEE